MKRHFKKSFILLLSASLAGGTRSSACDMCDCFTPSLEIRTDKPVTYYASVAEQFTHYGSVQLDGHGVSNPTGQYMNSSITQIVVGASLLENRLSIQVNVPLISRSFKRPEGFAIDHGTESGVGDLTLLANWTIFRTGSPAEGPSPSGGKDSKVVVRQESDFSTSLNLVAGLKFPTGSASRIKEEFNENEVEGAPPSGIHGHDLALGTGSWDGVFGLESFTRWKSLFLEAGMQYIVRGEGAHSYRYANEISWSGGPGVFLHREEGNFVGLQASVSGHSKGKDTFQGEEAQDTGMTSLFLGPRVLAGFGNFSADLGWEWPLLLHNTSFQSVPDYRFRASITYHF